MIAWLLAEGANINVTNDELSTPLHYAVIDKEVRMVDYLISHKANIDAKMNT